MMRQKKLLALLFVFNSTFLFSQTYDKWIVVTTIQYPTEAVRKLATLPDWHLVVVADKKTPSDWHLDNCEFLSVEKQQQLPYGIISLLPWNHYCRKNIGYLYAIEHGAQVIYETDDDNYIIGDSIIYLPERAKTLQYETAATSINPYAHFGQPKVWPRGYPLSTITAPTLYTLQEKQSYIPIQQGLVNCDPDVDAIFRLTQGSKIIFDSKKQPVSLPAKTCCPFNSQNTVFHYSAFWGMLIPITTSFRVCDIWRSYWVQRILWDMHASVSFLPPTANQYRNEHNLLKDFADELDVYLKTEKFIAALNAWHSDKPLLSDRMKDLMSSLVDQEFFKTKEKLLLQAWLDDLQALGYHMQAITNN